MGTKVNNEPVFEPSQTKVLHEGTTNYDISERHLQSSNPNVNPSHYKSDGMEVIDVIRAFTKNLNGREGYFTGNILKYICRWKNKNGIEDLEKAMWYLNELITYEKTIEGLRTI